MRTREYVIFFLRLHHVKVDDEQSSGMKSESSWTIIQKKRNGERTRFLCKYTRSTDGDDYDSLSSFLIIQAVRVSSNVFFLPTRSRSFTCLRVSIQHAEWTHRFAQLAKVQRQIAPSSNNNKLFQSNRTDWHERTCRRGIFFLSSVE